MSTRARDPLAEWLADVRVRHVGEEFQSGPLDERLKLAAAVRGGSLRAEEGEPEPLVRVRFLRPISLGGGKDAAVGDEVVLPQRWVVDLERRHAVERIANVADGELREGTST